MSKSGKEVGDQYVERVQGYLASVQGLPLLLSGALSISAVADAANVPRQSLYKNPTIRQLVSDAKVRFGLKSQHELGPDNGGELRPNVATRPTSGKLVQLERRVGKLEQQNAALVAENSELRRQLKTLRLQVGRDDMTIETGRRIAIPSNS